MLLALKSNEGITVCGTQTTLLKLVLTQKHFTSLCPPSSPQAHLEEDKTFVLLDDEDDDENDNEGKDDFLEDDTETDVHDVTG